MGSEPDDKSDEGRVIEVLGRSVTISHPNKIVFPEIGATKLELVEYYLGVVDQLAVSA
jgi:bifunctional non-homologous end joining protein LigD